MIRFIHIGDQINDDEQAFAWYDTVTDQFLSYSGFSAWTSWKAFFDDLTADCINNWDLNDRPKRFASLFPEDWPPAPPLNEAEVRQIREEAAAWIEREVEEELAKTKEM